MRLANMAFEELTEAMNRGWGTRNSSVRQLLQVERSGIEPPPSIRNACRRSSTPTRRSKPLPARRHSNYRNSSEAPLVMRHDQ
jgi:hypothetical protein